MARSRKKVKALFSSPVGLEDIVRIKITGDIPNKISTEALVEIIITKQPASKIMGEGYIKRIISEDNSLEMASALSVSKHNLRTEWNKSIVQDSQRLAKTLIGPEEGYVDL